MDTIAFTSKQRTKILGMGILPIIVLMLFIAFFEKTFKEFNFFGFIAMYVLFFLIYSIFFAYKKYDKNTLQEQIYSLSVRVKTWSKISIVLLVLWIALFVFQLILIDSKNTGVMVAYLFLIHPINIILILSPCIFVATIFLKTKKFFIEKFLLSQINSEKGDDGVKTIEAYSQNIQGKSLESLNNDSEKLKKNIIKKVWFGITTLVAINLLFIIVSIIDFIYQTLQGNTVAPLFMLVIPFEIPFALLYAYFTYRVFKK